MSLALPLCMVGTTRVRPANRAAFGAFLDAAWDGRGMLLTEGSSWVWDVLRSGDRLQRWEVCALVPHVAGYVREATDHGLFGAAVRRVRRIPFFAGLRLGVQGLFNVRGVLRRDFTTLLRLLLAMETASFRRVRPPVVFLHPQMTDLLLALDNGRAVGAALAQIRRGGAVPGLATNNLGHLLPRLQAWGIDVPCVLAPMHPDGYGMRPDRPACEAALETFSGQLVTTVESPCDDRVAAYWQARRVTAAVYDVPEPNLEEWQACRSWVTRAGRAPVAAAKKAR